MKIFRYKNFLIILIIYAITALFLTRDIAFDFYRMIGAYPWGRVSSFELFRKIFLSPWLINSHLNIPIYGFHVLNYQNIFWAVSKAISNNIYLMLYIQLIFILTMSGLTMFSLIYFTLEKDTLYYSCKNPNFWQLFVSFLGGLYYMTSYFIFSYAMRLHLLFAYSLFPLTILLCWLSIENCSNKGFKWNIMNGIVISVISINSPRYLVLSCLIVSIFYLGALLEGRWKFKECTFNLVVLYFIIFGLNLYDILIKLTAILGKSTTITPVLIETITTRYVFSPILNMLGLINFKVYNFFSLLDTFAFGGRYIFLAVLSLLFAIGLFGFFLRDRSILLYKYMFFLYFFFAPFIKGENINIYLCEFEYKRIFLSPK
ncbi:MAG TPA: hypothetical protein ENI51_04945 [Candidatus Atribacteria bacterium]|nr:hypothetical protein [Candidatus Atribacteria bacterium]